MNIENNRRAVDSKYYDKLRENEWKNTADFGPSARSRYDIIMNIAKNYLNSNSLILDVGCGSGNLLLKLKREGYLHLFGSDFSIESIKLTEKKFGKNVFQADLTKIEDYKNNKYDGIICSEVLEHIENDNLAIQNIKLLLNKNGIVIISVPYGMQYWSQHDNFSGHLRRYENRDLENILINNGFTILESFGWGNLIYSIYHQILRKKNPTSVMSQKNQVLKIVISKIIYLIFTIEKFSKSKIRAKRIFVVAKKYE